MNIVTLGIAAASVVVGLGGAGVAYEIATVDEPTAASSKPVDAKPKAAERQVKWKPCVKPAVREGRACVTEVVSTVSVGGDTATSNAPVSIPSFAGSDDFASRDGFDDSDHDESHDAFDDHGGDSHDAFDDDDDWDDDSSGHGGDDDDDDDWDDDDRDDRDDDRDDDDDDDDDDDWDDD